MFECKGKKSYKKLSEEHIEFCPFYFEWECKDCNYYKKDKNPHKGDAY